MAAGAAGDDFEAAAAEGLGDDGVGAGAIDDNAVCNGIAPARRLEDMAHAAQVAFSFFAHVANEDEGQGVRNLRAGNHGRDGEHGGDTGAVVGNSGAIQASALLADVERRGCRKHGVDMRAEGDVAVAVTGAESEDVADLVDLDMGEADFTEAGGQPLGTGCFAKGRGGDARSIHLPLRDLGFFKTESAEGGANLGQCGKASDFLLNGRKYFNIRHRRVDPSFPPYLITKRLVQERA